MNTKEFAMLIKEMIKEEMEKRSVLLETPIKSNVDKLLTESINKLFSGGEDQTK